MKKCCHDEVQNLFQRRMRNSIDVDFLIDDGEVTDVDNELDVEELPEHKDIDEAVYNEVVKQESNDSIPFSGVRRLLVKQ